MSWKKNVDHNASGFNVRLAQANLITKTDFDAKMSF